MGNLPVTIEGLSQTQTRLKALSGELHAALVAVVEEASAALAADMRKGAPVDTGALAEDVGVKEKDDLHHEVGVFSKRRAHIARFVEHGTSSTPAQPFMLPAAELERKRLPGRVAKHIGKLT